MNVLFVCSANIDRSPTAEKMYKNVPCWQVMSAGILSDAVNPITKELIEWADHLIVMEPKHRDAVPQIDPGSIGKILVLDIEDNFQRNSEQLIKLIEEKMKMFQDSISEKSQ